MLRPGIDEVERIGSGFAQITTFDTANPVRKDVRLG